MLRFRNAINDFGQIPAGLFRFDKISALSLIRRNVYFLTVDKKVAMIYQLSCPSSIGCKTHTIDDVVKTSLEQLRENLSGNALFSFRLIEIPSKFSFKKSVYLPDFLFFSELNAIV